MDYGDLLLKAFKNDRKSAKTETRCYKKALGPPRKSEKKGVSSENVKKFLSRREKEERKKREDFEGEKAKLLALRNEKRIGRPRKKLITPDEAVIEEFRQCDEDDYGFVSQESSDIYTKILHKYMKEQPTVRPGGIYLENQERCKVSNISLGQNNIQDKNVEKGKENNNQTKDPTNSTVKDNKLSKPKKESLAPISFIDLLEIAKKKQFEPIVIKKPTECDARPMTQREKIDSQLKFKREKEESDLVTKESNKTNSLMKERLKTFRSMSEKEKLDLYKLVQKAKSDSLANTYSQSFDTQPMLEKGKPLSFSVFKGKSEIKYQKGQACVNTEHTHIRPNVSRPTDRVQVPAMAKGTKSAPMPMKVQGKSQSSQIVKERKREASTEFRPMTKRAMAKSFFF